MLTIKKGFTILEMAIVIGIVGLIGFFTVPKIIQIVQHSKIESTRNQLVNLRDEVVGYFLMKDGKELPSDKMGDKLKELGKPKDAWKSDIHFETPTGEAFIIDCENNNAPNLITLQDDNGQLISDSVAFFLASDGPNYTQQWDRPDDGPDDNRNTITLWINDSDFDDIYQFVTLSYLQRRLCAQVVPDPNNGSGNGSGNGPGPGLNPTDYVLHTGGVLSLPSGSHIQGSVAGERVEVKSANSIVTGNIISRTSVNVSSGSRVEGSICAAFGDVVLGSANTFVAGDIFAHGNVDVGNSVSVMGNIFAFGDVTLQSSHANVANDIHAGNNVSIRSQSIAQKNVFSSGWLEMRNSHSEVRGNAHVGGNVNLDSNTNILGSVWTGGTINMPENVGGTANGNQPVPPRILPTPPIECPEVPKPRLQFFTAGVNDIIYSRGGSPLPLNPGSYRNLSSGGNHIITLRSGTCNSVTDSGCFFFENIDLATDSLTLRFDLSEGEKISIFTKGNVSFAGRVEISEDGISWTSLNDLNDNYPERAKELAKRVYLEVHGSFSITTNNSIRQWFGTVLSKNNISLPSNFYGIGAYATVDGSMTVQASQPKITYVVADFARDHW